MNYNIILNKQLLGFEQLRPFNNSLIQLITSILNYLIPVLYLIQFTILQRMISKYTSQNKKSYYIWLAIASPFTYYQVKFNKIGILIHTLIVLIIWIQNINKKAMLMSILLYIQPNYLTLLIVVYYQIRKEQNYPFKKFAKLLIFYYLVLIIIEIILQGNLLHLKHQYSKIYFPKLYEPNFNLIWLFYIHFFIDYQIMYSYIFLIFPLLCIYPIILVISRIPIQMSITPVLVNISLFITYYFSITTNIYDIYLFYLLLIPSYRFLKCVSISVIYAIGSIFFFLMSILTVRQWQNSFTVSISYVFFMLMPFYGFNCIYFVEVINSLGYLIIPKEIKGKLSLKQKIKSFIMKKIDQM